MTVAVVLAQADPATSAVTIRSAVIRVGANTYPYVNGNPINAWDPTGHMWDDLGDAWDDIKDVGSGAVDVAGDGLE